MTTITLKIDFETLSHELRTPLTGILGITEVMECEDLPQSLKAQLAVIHQSGDRLMLIINQLLTNTQVKAHIRN